MTPERLAALHLRSFQVPRPWSASAFNALMRSDGVFVLGDDAGFVMGRTVAEECELLTLAVDPDARRRGHGRSLLAQFEARATKDGATRAILEVAQDNLAAVGLYQAAGWAEIGRRPRYYRSPEGYAVDALLMEKTFSTA